MEEIVKSFGQVAGIGGVALGVFLLLFRQLDLPAATRRHITLFMWLVWSVAIVGVASYTIITLYGNPSIENPPYHEPRTTEKIRLNVKGITYGYKNGADYIHASLSLANTSDQTILVNDASLILNAISNSTGAVLTKHIELLANENLQPGSIVPIEINRNIEQWKQLLKPTSESPLPNTHWINFFLNVQATPAISGREIWLDVEAPKPSPMTCDHPCVAIYSLNIPAGSSSYKKCTVIPNGTKWELDCVQRE